MNRTKSDLEAQIMMTLPSLPFKKLGYNSIYWMQSMLEYKSRMSVSVTSVAYMHMSC